MALRIRKDGRILCAALHQEEPGDIYIDDGVHYQLSIKLGVLLSEPEPEHSKRGEWWWTGQVPKGVVVDDSFSINRKLQNEREAQTMCCQALWSVC